MIVFDNTSEANAAIKADALCKTIGNALVKHYPGRQWYVDVSPRGGVIKILCPAISMQYGYTVSLDKPLHEIERASIFAAGQILEMFKLSRELPGGEEKLLRDVRGEVINARTGL